LEISVLPDAVLLRREQSRSVNTLWTVITIAAVVAILATVLWTVVVAPFWVPRHSGKP
jgi:hypothetical protein